METPALEERGSWAGLVLICALAQRPSGMDSAALGRGQGGGPHVPARPWDWRSQQGAPRDQLGHCAQMNRRGGLRAGLPALTGMSLPGPCGDTPHSTPGGRPSERWAGSRRWCP